MSYNDPHKKFKIFCGIFDLLALIFFVYLMYSLNTSREFSFFANIKFIGSYIIIYIGISLMNLLIYSWRFTDVHDDIKDRVYPVAGKYMSLLFSITHRFNQFMKPVIATIIFSIIIFGIIYYSTTHLISLF